MIVDIEPGYDPENVDELYAIEKECFRDGKFGRCWGKREMANILGQQDVWVARVDEEAVGLLVGHLVRGTPEINVVEVKKAFHGKQIGTKLIDEAESYYRDKGFRFITLQVRAENPAQTLYFRLGYRVTGFHKRKNSRLSVLKMRKALK